MLVAEKNFSFLVFGASGALAKVKIFPSLYEMALEGRLQVKFKIVGFSRTEMSSEEFRMIVRQAVYAKFEVVDDKILQSLLDNCFYFTGDYSDLSDYERFEQFVADLEGEDFADGVRIAYFAVPPLVVEPIADGLAKFFNLEKLPEIRLVLEKPFGSDYQSAKALKQFLFDRFNKKQVFLLDHYLGKEGVFNLLSLRYANPIFSYLLQGKYISNVQISALEPDKLDDRAGYFDAVGTLKDMVQSHLFQILAFLTMNVPREFNADLVHKSKVNLLNNLYWEKSANNVVRGQYDRYKQEKGVDKDSKTETFVALKVGIDVPEWHSVPIFLRTGKALKTKWTGVVIEFKSHQNQSKLGLDNVNRLLIEIQPNEKVEFYMFTKKGGEEMEFVPLTTGKPIYCSGDCVNEHARLLLDVIKGDNLLFLDFQEVYESWRIIDQIEEVFASRELPLASYEEAGLGPKEADKFIERFGFEWFNGFKN